MSLYMYKCIDSSKKNIKVFSCANYIISLGTPQTCEDVGQPAVFDREYYSYLMLIHLSIKLCRRSQTDTQYMYFSTPSSLIFIPYVFSTLQLLINTVSSNEYGLTLASLSLSCATMDSDSPSSPNLKRGIRTVR